MWRTQVAGRTLVPDLLWFVHFSQWFSPRSTGSAPVHPPRIRFLPDFEILRLRNLPMHAKVAGGVKKCVASLLPRVHIDPINKWEGSL
jgi:hypothetical protein